MQNTNQVDNETNGRGVVSGRLVRVSGEPALVGAPSSKPTQSQPTLEMIRDGDVLRAIDIICNCGTRIRLRCIYSDP